MQNDPSPEDQETSWRVAQRRLFFAGVTSAIDAPPEEIRRMLIACEIDRDDIRTIADLVGNDGIWAVRKALEEAQADA